VSLKKGLILLLFMGPLCASGFLPPTAKSTSREMLDYRNRKKLEYENKRQEYDQQLINSRVKVETALNNLPWESRSARSIPSQRSLADSYQSKIIRNEKHTPLFSLFLIPAAVLILILLRKKMFPSSGTP
jgi:hypothetical protein